MEQHATPSTSTSAMAKPPLSPNRRRSISAPIPAASPTIRTLAFPAMSRSPPSMPKPPTPPSRVEIVSNVAQKRSALQRLGQRPDHEKVDVARCKLREVESDLSKKLHEIVLSPRPENLDRIEWRKRLAEREKQCREEAEKQVSQYRALVLLDDMHEAYGRSLREAEERLMKVYESSFDKIAPSATDMADVEVVDSLREALRKTGFERVDFSARRLRVLPEKVLGSIRRVVLLNLSANQLQEIPESIAGLDSLEELNISSNLLSSLPESVGLFRKLRVLNVSGNKLNALPDSISHCRSLVELDVSFNNLTYLPTDIGYELSNLQVLFIQYNKIRSLPSSVCEMRSLRHLDAHFNELCGLPSAIGKLKNLEILNLSSNFSDLTELPDSIGDLTQLRELDVGSNQIKVLPVTFGRLHSLIKLNLDQNPLANPPMEVVNQGVEAIKTFMAKRCMVEKEEASTSDWIADTRHVLVESLCYRCFQECFRGESNWREGRSHEIIN